MKNYAMPLAIAVVGLGLMSIGFNLNGNTATATQGVFNAGPEELTIVWYESHSTTPNGDSDGNIVLLLRAWSDGTIEGRVRRYDTGTGGGCDGVGNAGTCGNSNV